MNKNSLLSDNYFDKIEPYLYEIMDSDVAHTVHALSVELRTEYPQEYDLFNRKFSNEYSLKGCGQRHAYVNGLTLFWRICAKRESRKNHEKRCDLLA